MQRLAKVNMSAPDVETQLPCCANYDAEHPDVSPNGQTAVFDQNTDDAYGLQIYTVNMNGLGAPTGLTTLGEMTWPRYSPSGLSVACDSLQAAGFGLGSGISGAIASSDVFSLREVGPNPVSPNRTVAMKWQLPQAALVTVDIYDDMGRFVRALLCRQNAAGPGSTVWDLTDARQHRVSSGIYLCRFRAGAHTATRKLVVE
jgi:hypothetical protein